MSGGIEVGGVKFRIGARSFGPNQTRSNTAMAYALVLQRRRSR